MRTTVTIDIDRDVLAVAKTLAGRRGSSLGSALSELARRGFRSARPVREGEDDAARGVGRLRRSARNESHRASDNGGYDMRERHIEIQELQANLSGCLEEVQHGTTLLLTDGEHRVARIVPEPATYEPKHDLLILPGRGRLTKTRPKAHLRGEGAMADLVRENRR